MAKTKLKTANKKAVQKKSLKTTSRVTSKSAPRRSALRKLVEIEAIDRKLLNMAYDRYNQILKQIELGKKRLNEERRLALNLGTRILDKAKKVRNSLMGSAAK